MIRGEHDIQDPTILALSNIVHHIEVSFWGPENLEATIVENWFREFQRREGRADIGPDCFLAFFDAVHQRLTNAVDGSLASAVAPDIRCEEVFSKIAESSDKFIVPEVPIEDLLREIDRERKIVFVDVREPEEFNEAHIPGAINIPIRDITEERIAAIKDADYIVPYCVKDFRGFEAARNIKHLGAGGTVILSPFGISGWVREGLPVAGDKGLAEETALSRLRECASAGCKKEG